MTSTYYMPISDSGKADLLNHLAFNLPQYQTLLNLSEEDLNGIMQDSIGFKFALQSMDIMQANAKSWTAYKNEIRDGVLGLGTAAWPIPPLFIEPCPTAVLPGVMPRLSTLVAQIKANKNYTLTVGEDLWLVGTHPTIDPNTWKPNARSNCCSSRTSMTGCAACWSRSAASPSPPNSSNSPRR